MNNYKVAWYKVLAYSLLLFPHLKPASLQYIAIQWESIFDALRLLSTAIILVLYFIKVCKKKKISGIISIIIAYELSLFISTLLNHGDYWSFLISAGSVISLCILVELMVTENSMLCFNAMLPLLEILVYSNLLTIFLFPYGMYYTQHFTWGSNNTWLLGYDNVHIGTILPAFLISLLRDNFKGKGNRISIRTALLLVAGYITIFMRWPATSVVGLLFFGIYLIAPKLFKLTGLFNCRNYIIFNIIFFVAIILLRLQDYFADFIEGFLGKSLSFTGRTLVWDASLMHIANAPILGAGVETAEEVYRKFGLVHTHNQYLWDLYRGGIVYFSCFVVAIIMIAKKLMKYKKERMAQLISLVVFIILLMWQVEAFNSMMFFGIYVLAYHIDTMIAQREAYQTEKGMLSE